MLRLAICDENKPFLTFLYRSLLKWIKSCNINIDVLMFENGDELLFNIEESGHFQIVFIEIELKKSDSLKVAAQIIHHCASTIIIFISTIEYCHKRIYKIHPFYFFTKPIKYDELSSVMKKALNKLDVENQAFRFLFKAYHYSILINEIVYFYSNGRKVFLVSFDNEYSFYGKLDFINKEMQAKANAFLRIHKSYLINMRHIKIYQGDCVEVKGGDCLPVSRARRLEVRDVLRKEWK